MNADLLREAARTLREDPRERYDLPLADWLDDLADHDPSPLMPTEAGAFKVADAVLGGEES